MTLKWYDNGQLYQESKWEKGKLLENSAWYDNGQLCNRNLGLQPLQQWYKDGHPAETDEWLLCSPSNEDN